MCLAHQSGGGGKKKASLCGRKEAFFWNVSKSWALKAIQGEVNRYYLLILYYKIPIGTAGSEMNISKYFRKVHRNVKRLLSKRMSVFLHPRVVMLIRLS